MEKTLELAVNLSQQLFSAASSVVSQYGEDAVNLALWVVRVNALSELMYGVGALITAVISWKIFVWAKVGVMQEDNSCEAEFGFMASCIASFIGILVSGLVVFLTFLNIWLYIAVVKPELYLAKQAIDVVLKDTKK